MNYHKLTHKLLDNLTYSYVQDWINLQAADARSGKPGADLRLAAAQALQEKLKLILAGEPPSTTSSSAGSPSPSSRSAGTPISTTASG